MNQAVLDLLKLDARKYKVEKITEESEKGKTIRVITIRCISKKHKCPICNKYTSSIHDVLSPVKLKFLDIAGYQSKILLIKRRFICHDCKNKFTEPTELNNKKCSISNKVKIQIRKDLLDYNLSMKYIAKKNNVSDVEVRNELLDAMSGYPEHLTKLPEIISLDEFSADTSFGKYALIINDPINKNTLDILQSRKKEYLINYFTKIQNRKDIKYVVSDMYEPYLLVTKIMFPKAKYVADRFHYERHVMDALDAVRIKMQEEKGIPSKEYRLLKNKKNVSLLRIHFDKVEDWYAFTKRYKNGHIVEIMKIDILHEMLEISDELNRGYQLKELFLDTVKKSNYDTATEELLSWIELCRESKIEEFVAVSNTIETWLPYIVNSFIDERFSNGYTEGLNNKIKVIKRIAFGFKNFSFYRLRLMYVLNKKIRS